MRRVAATVLVALAALLVAIGTARTEDDPASGVEIDVGEGMTLIDPGTPVAGARAAYVEDGQVGSPGTELEFAL